MTLVPTVRTVLRIGLGALVVLHGVLHLLGAAKGLGVRDVATLSQPISPAIGVLWLAVAVLLLVAGVMVLGGLRGWTVVGLAAAVLSQLLVVTAWSDAKAGTVPNVILATAAVLAMLAHRSDTGSWRFRNSVQQSLARIGPSYEVTDLHLSHLPPPVATYLRRAGSVGRPSVVSVHASLHGRIRSDVASPWMPFSGEQLNTYGEHLSRHFRITATRSGIPVDVVHAYVEGRATMTAKAFSLFPVTRAAGPHLDQAETVTVLNDMCVLAPAALIDANITWATIDDRRAVATFRNEGITVRAELRFDESGDLVDFVSDDRLRASANGKTLLAQRWSTPLREPRNFDGRRLPSIGEGRWHAPPPAGEFSYLEIVLDDVKYNSTVHLVADPTSRTAAEHQLM